MTPPIPEPAPPSVPTLEIAHVLFMDIAAYSKLPMDQQQKLLWELQEAVRSTQAFARAHKDDKLISLPTGDGMALVFFGDPEFPVRCAVELSRALHQHPEIKLRMGIHTGPVYRVDDINAARNVAGGGINMAQRVMDCGDAGHILVSNAVAEVLTQISRWSEAFQDLGEAEVKHGIHVHIYNLCTDGAGNTKLPQKLAPLAPELPAGKADRKGRRTWYFKITLEIGAIAALVVVIGLVIWLLPRTPQPMAASLNIQTRPGAQILIDGKEAGTAANNGTIAVSVSPNESHQLQAQLEGYEPWSGNVTAQAGEQKPIVARLEPPTAPSSLPPVSSEVGTLVGTLVVRSNVPGADVFIDGKQWKDPTGRDNKLKVPLEPGAHRVQLKASGYQDSAGQQVEIVAEKGKQLSFKLIEIESQTYVKIESNPPGASVRIDDKAAGSTVKGRPLSRKVLQGSHTVQFNLEGYEPQTERVTVEEGKSQSVRVDLKLQPVLSPSISAFTAAPDTVKKGERIQLKWEAQHATDISIDNGVGTFRSLSGSQEVQPPETTTYTLTAKGPGGSATARATVNVTAPAALPEPAATGTFSSSAAEIDEGQSAQLIWDTRNAKDVRINPEASGLGPRGSIKVSPTKTTTYTLIAKGPGGDYRATAEIVVHRKTTDNPTVSSGGSADAEAIKELVLRFGPAYGDCKDLMALWPSLTSGQCRPIEDSAKRLKQMRLKDNCPGSPSISGDAAEWNCTETVTYLDGNKRSSTPPTQVAFRFKKTNGVWYVDGHSVK